MKIKKITIRNFGCYKNEQIIEFNQDNKITMILGKSGSGKSTISAFIRWMFYETSPEFVNHISNSYMPLYNEEFFKELPENSQFDVFGSIEFIHDDINYVLFKNITYKKKMYEAKVINSEYKLNYKYKNGSWISYNGSIIEKIDEIIPKALSKFFFFSGEKNFVRDYNYELKQAIYNLFGISKYENAIAHIGTKGTSNTLLFMYNSKKLKSKPTSANIKASDALEQAIRYREIFEDAEKKYNDKNTYLQFIEKQIEDLTKKIAQYPNSEKEKQHIKMSNDLIHSNDELIKGRIAQISSILYKSSPYLLLSEQAKITQNILSESAKEEKTFIGLTKETLLDIKNQKMCVCGRCLDEKSLKHIDMIINSMPPHSYNYIYNQFVRTLKTKTQQSNENLTKLDELLQSAISLRTKNNDIQEEISKLIKKLSESNNKSAAEDARKLQNYKDKKSNLNKELSDLYTRKVIAENKYKKLKDAYDAAAKFESESAEFDDRIAILSRVKDKLERYKEAKITNTVNELNKSMIEVNEQLSTRIQIFEDEKFIDENFSPKEAYFTGGQEVIAHYSYIVGMIKALNKVSDNEENEDFPLVIDAPFSKLDDDQVSHIVNVFPKIVKQIIMISIDSNRIKDKDKQNIGKVWEINSNSTQTVSEIKEGKTYHEI